MYAATMTGFSGGSADTLRDVTALDGTAVLEAKDDGAGNRDPVEPRRHGVADDRIYYLRVRQFNTTSLSGAIHPYDFYLRVLSGSPIPETEPHNEGAPRAPRSNGWGAV
jgi:hypothetical protein